MSDFGFQLTGIRIEGSRFRVYCYGSVSRVQGSGWYVLCSVFVVHGSGLRVRVVGFRVLGFEFRVSGFGVDTWESESDTWKGERSAAAPYTRRLFGSHRPSTSWYSDQGLAFRVHDRHNR